jgi:hypothetical protein
LGALKASVQDGGAPVVNVTDAVVATVVCDAESVSTSPAPHKMETRE